MRSGPKGYPTLWDVKRIETVTSGHRIRNLHPERRTANIVKSICIDIRYAPDVDRAKLAHACAAYMQRRKVRVAHYVPPGQTECVRRIEPVTYH